MSDDDVVRGEEKRLREARWNKLRRTMAQRWIAEGYNPVRHLWAMKHDGDEEVFRGWMGMERDASRFDGVASWLAAWDMNELWRSAAVQRREAQMRTAGALEAPAVGSDHGK